MTEWQIPAPLRHSRFGITAFHHPNVAEVLWRATPEAQLLDLVDQVCLTETATEWQGTAVELQELLSNDRSLARVARQLLKEVTACSTCLGKLAVSPRTRGRVTRVLEGETIRWSIRRTQQANPASATLPRTPSSPISVRVTKSPNPRRRHTSTSPTAVNPVSEKPEPPKASASSSMAVAMSKKRNPPIVVDLKPYANRASDDLDVALRLINVLLRERFQR